MSTINQFPGEQWQTVDFNFDCTNEGRIEVSNYGRLRTFHKGSNGNLINGSLTNGYRIIRLKLYAPRENAAQQKFDEMQKEVNRLNAVIKLKKAAGENADELIGVLLDFRSNMSKEFKVDLKRRTKYFHALIHRLVADHFLRPPAENETIVAHLDHDKMNNRSGNLKWMTPDENYLHQKSSPHVIKERELRRYPSTGNGKTKLSVTKVMLMKKLLNEGKSLKQLVKQFKVTGTQIKRIQRGENWSDIEAAK